jgi:eukaryotic-like serine/threonine-protein kinase
MPVELRSLKELFLAVLAVAPAERTTWLERECGPDVDLRRRVELTLAAHDTPQSLLDRLAPAAEPPETGTGTFTGVEGDRSVSAECEGAGAVIAGRYKLVEVIGEGGMGTVWMAQQTEPVKRQVAVKLIKLGMDSKQVLARFEAERQALALMDHPNIAQVLDAGTTTAGRPYFVMELVKGVPITRYCDEHRLTARQRLELLIHVCQAIQHAHQKGIIHRDIKPSNVLVCLYDDQPVPKVIDFGIAKATGQQLTEKPLVTGCGTVVGTLECMSPEQAELNNQDIDTRSDIYSLGVLLYELLTGTTPLDRKRLQETPPLDALRLIREEEPPRPSIRLNTLGQDRAIVSANRKSEPHKLSQLLRGELDWIVMKALEKDRNRRYETANGFAMDVQRYLADEPVQACPPSLGYRLGKFLRRNRGPTLAATLVLLALLGGIIGTTWGMFQAVAEAEEKEKARALALQESDRAGKAEQQATLDRNEAITKRNEARNQRYCAVMKPLSRLWREGSHLQVRRELDVLRPGPGEDDLRGWEWHYQDRLCRAALRTLKGHSEEGLFERAQALAFSPDGRWLASGGAGERRGGSRPVVILWDVTTGEEVRRFEADKLSEAVGRVAFSPDGKTLAAAGDRTLAGAGDRGGGLQLWEVASGRQLHSLESNVERCEGLAFSPDGRQLVSAGKAEREGAVEVWEVAGGQLQGSWKTGKLLLAAFNTEGQVLTVTKADVTLHEPATGKALGSFAHGQVVKRDPEVDEDSEWPMKLFAAASADGRWLALADDTGVWRWEVATGQKRHLLYPQTRKDINGLAVSPDGLRTASAGRTGTIMTWNLWKGGPREDSPRHNTIPAFEAPVVCVAYSPDGLRLAAAGYDGAIRIFDAADTGQGARLFAGLDGRRVAFTADGSKFLVLPFMPPQGMPILCDAVSGHKLPGPAEGIQGPAAYSPDGRWLATNCKDGIRLWDTATYREARTLDTTRRLGRLTILTNQVTQEFRSTNLTYLADGRLLSVTERVLKGVSLAPTVMVQIWDTSSGKDLFFFEDKARSPGRVVITPDGRRLAAYTAVRPPPGKPNVRTQPELNVWDLEKWQQGVPFAPVLTLQPHSKAFADLAFSPDGKLLVTSGADQDGSNAVKFWDAVTGKAMRSIPWPVERTTGGVGRVVFSADGRRLAATGSGRVTVWDVADDREVFTAKIAPVDSLALSPNGAALVVGYHGTTRIWDLATGREQRTLKLPPTFSGGLAFSPDGRSLAIGGQDLGVWDAVSGEELHTLASQHVASQYSPSVISMAVSPVGNTLATSGEDGTVRVWDLNGWKPLWVLPGGAYAIAFSPDGRLLATASGNWGRTTPSEVQIWDLTERRARVGTDPMHHLKGQNEKEGVNEKVVALGFSADVQRLVSVSEAGTVKVWDVARGQEISSAKVAKDRSGGAAVSPDGELLAYGGQDGTVRLWDLSRGREVRALAVDDQERRGRKMSTVDAVAFSPDGRRLAAASAGVVRIWELPTFQEVYTISPAGAGKDLAFSPDGGRLIGVGNMVIRKPIGGTTVGSSLGVLGTAVLWDGRPLTPKREAERESLGVLDQLFSRGLPRKDVLEYLRTSPALSEPVRQAALRLAAHY